MCFSLKSREDVFVSIPKPQLEAAVNLVRCEVRVRNARWVEACREYFDSLLFCVWYIYLYLRILLTDFRNLTAL